MNNANMKGPYSMTRTIRALIVTTMTIAVCAIAPTLAHAGTVNVSPNFHDGSATVYSDGWSYGIAGFNIRNGGINPHFPNNPAVGSPGNRQWVRTPRLPANVHLETAAFTLTRSVGGGRPFLMRMCTRGLDFGILGCGTAANNSIQLASTTGTVTSDTGIYCDHVGGVGAPSCDAFEFGTYQSSSTGFADFTNTHAVVSDNTAPTHNVNYNSNQLASGNWLRGTVSAGVTTTDSAGVGAASTTLILDTIDRQSKNHSCNYGAWIPCPQSVNWSTTVDTTSLSDGTHGAAYRSTDAANTTGQTATFTVKTDNTKPATPAAVVAQTTGGMNGWSTNNDFDVSWTNNGETAETSDQSGIEAVIASFEQINDPTPASPWSSTIPVGSTVDGITATIDSLSGITVPEEGEWQVTIQTRDRAGNISDVGSGNDPATDGKTTIGYSTEDPGDTDGQANGWISRDELAAGYDQEFGYTPPINAIAPVCGFAASVDKDINGTTGTSINVPGGADADTWRLPGTLDEAMHYVHIRAVSCNGKASPQSATIEAPVDRTDPVGSISGVENGKWYKDGQVADLSATDALSGMQGAPESEAFSTRGAYLSYSINGNGPADIDSPRGAATSIPVTGEGPKELRFSPVDLAGNKAAAKVVSFGIDATNPIGFINRQNASTPTLLKSQLGDVPSGVSYAIFSIRKQGSGDAWENLPTSTSGVDGSPVGNGASSALASARFPDTSKEPGTYDVKVTAFDQAGNALATQRYEDGSVASVENPMRAKTGLNIKLFKALRKCTIKKKKRGRKTVKVKCIVKKCTKKTKGTCYRKFRGKVVLVGGSNTVTSEYKRASVAVGVLTNEAGRPMANEDVTISTTEKFSGHSRVVGRTKTDENGLYSLRVPAGVSRTVRASYEGTETRRPAAATADMLTRAKLTLKLNKKRARTGQTVTFSGRVTPFDSTIPKGGKIVALQFYAAKKWRPAVAVAHTNSKGRFKIKYKFDGAKVKAKIIFRVVAPAEDGWGHTYTLSKPKVIRLNF